jgi:hypothetical protein
MAPGVIKLDHQARPMSHLWQANATWKPTDVLAIAASPAILFRRLRFARPLSGAGLRFALLFGALAIVAAFGGNARAEEMTFNVTTIGDATICGRTCPAIIAANGEITNRTPSVFLDFLQRNSTHAGLHAIILLNSPGGKVVASMELGRMFRRLGAAAIVARVDDGAPGALLAGKCFSACVYALIGGKKRVIPPQSEVGIHRMFTYEYNAGVSGMFGSRHQRYDDGGMRAVLARYSGSMGVSPQLILTAERINSDQIYIPSRAEIARWHLGASRF